MPADRAMGGAAASALLYIMLIIGVSWMAPVDGALSGWLLRTAR
jgi:hypothetical protein